MKIKKITRNKKFLVGVLVVLILIGAGAFSYVYFQSTQQKNTDESKSADERKRVNTINLNPATVEEKQTGVETKKAAIEKEDKTSQPNNSSLNVSITSTNTYNETLVIRTLIENFTGNGSCELKMTKSSKVILKTADIQALPSSSTCKGFDIPLSETSSGTWITTITVTADNRQGKTTRDIEL